MDWHIWLIIGTLPIVFVGGPIAGVAIAMHKEKQLVNRLAIKYGMTPAAVQAELEAMLHR